MKKYSEKIGWRTSKHSIYFDVLTHPQQLHSSNILRHSERDQFWWAMKCCWLKMSNLITVEFVWFHRKQIINCLWGFKIQAISQAFDVPFNLASASCLDIIVVVRAYKNVVRIHCITVASQSLMVFNAISAFNNSASLLLKCDAIATVPTAKFL